MSAYKNYLKGAHWQTTRQEFFRARRHKCRICKSSENISLHHRTYKRMGIESAINLVPLCQPCHDVLHHDPALRIFTYPEREMIMKTSFKYRKMRKKHRLLGRRIHFAFQRFQLEAEPQNAHIAALWDGL